MGFITGVCLFFKAVPSDHLHPFGIFTPKALPLHLHMTDLSFEFASRPSPGLGGFEYELRDVSPQCPPAYSPIDSESTCERLAYYTPSRGETTAASHTGLPTSSVPSCQTQHLGESMGHRVDNAPMNATVSHAPSHCCTSFSRHFGTQEGVSCECNEWTASQAPQSPPSAVTHERWQVQDTNAAADIYLLDLEAFRQRRFVAASEFQQQTSQRRCAQLGLTGVVTVVGAMMGYSIYTLTRT